MLSVIVYGRNDAYGYNLHKRAAISLNCFGHLIGEDDEIVFVDYNTPDDLPTFPEAIRDTLTEGTRRKLRILRVRPAVHLRQADPKALKVVEPLARNIALRRTNPANRWVLNTNTDIIIGMRDDRSFTDVVGGLSTGFYEAPRVELPESVWESFDRREPEAILANMKSLVPALHLDDIVYGNPSVMFDGPGDFQLAERELLFDIDGFDERMVRGWHVDANLAVRLQQHFGAISSLQDDLCAYHCDHTRQVTPLHQPDHIANDSSEFVDTVVDPRLPVQRASWGAADEEIEEIRLDHAFERRYFDALQTVLGEPQLAPSESAYRSDSFDQTDCDFSHVLPFLADLFSAAPNSLRIGWAGHVADRFRRFSSVIAALGMTARVFVLRGSARVAGANVVERGAWTDECDVFVFDFGDVGGQPLDQKRRSVLIGALDELRRREHRRAAKGLPPRRIVGVNVVHNRHERAFNCAVGATAAPFSTRVRVGYARPKGSTVHWAKIVSRGAQGLEASTTGLQAGRHFLHLELDSIGELGGSLAVVVAGEATGQGSRWTGQAVRLIDDPLILPFEVAGPEALVHVLIAGDSHALDAITDIWSGPYGESPPGHDSPEMMIGGGRNWLPHLHVGPTAERLEGRVEVAPGKRSHALFGPYWPLPEGRYAATFDIVVVKTRWSAALKTRRPLLHMDVLTSGGSRLARRFVVPTAGAHRVTVPFAVGETEVGLPIELRIFTGGASRFRVREVTVDARPT